MTSLTLKIDSGLAVFDCPDHYAILGIKIGASSTEIRKRYLRLARSLHPDSCGAEVDKDLASTLLSKLINPAYEVLSSDKQREEYGVLLRLVGKRVHQERQASYFKTKKARLVLEAEDYETLYAQSVAELAQTQYSSLQDAMVLVNQLSELNLAYLLRQQSQPTSSKPKPVVTASSPASAPPPPAPPETAVVPPSRPAMAPPPPQNSFVGQYCRRAEELIEKKAYELAIKELKDALALDGKHATCHSLLGTIYLQQNRPTMAKVHFSQALKTNPQEIMALKGMETLNKQQKAAQKAKGSQPVKPVAAAPKGKANAPKRSSFGFFGLFGGRGKKP